MMGNNATTLNGLSDSSWSSSDFPIPLRSLWALVVSFPALWDWVRLFLFGGLLESARRLLWSLYNYVAAQFVFTVTFDQNDATYRWMVVWLSNQPAWKRTRTLEVASRRPGQEGITDLLPAEDPDKNNKRKYVQYLPAPNECLYVRFRYTWIKAQRMQEVERGYYGGSSTTDKLTLTIYAFDRTILDELLLEAKRQYKANLEGRINIYVPAYQDWEPAGSRQRRSLSSVVLDKKVKDRLLTDAKDFMSSEKWYAERGIPWRRGYLLYGAPGCGKTSLIHALAGELELDIYIVSLSKSGLDDSDLHRLISRLPSKSLALIEDIDAAFLRSINRESTAAPDPQAPDADRESNDPSIGNAKNPMAAVGGITLSGLLNAIDGVAAQEGRLLFATTNKYDALDAALIRPGRLDVHIEFKLAERPQIEELFRCFYPSILKRVEEKSVEADSVDEPEPLIHINDEKETAGKSGYHSFSNADLVELSKAFAARIPESEFSMAAIQGHLMRYKTDPQAAIDEVEGWVKDERGQRKEKESSD